MRHLLVTVILLLIITRPVSGAELFLGQGTMSGEVTTSTALLQTRLTAATQLNASGDLPGAKGVASFQWSTSEDFSDANNTPLLNATEDADFIVRAELTQLQPGTRYYYRAIYHETDDAADAQKTGSTCSFTTLSGSESEHAVRFLVGSCMNYNKFMHGKRGNAGGSITATDEDKQLGYPAFAAMRTMDADFFVGTGDIVYYDNQVRPAETVAELRRCWHEQFRFPRMIEFFQQVPCYWSKDDHDFRFNDSDNASDRLPLSTTGIGLFREQVPITGAGQNDQPSYRTHRVNRDLQIWLTEGRDFRSPNRSPDGPDKTLWGKEQRDWLQQTLKCSDAKWKLIITPTPMIGPDDARKKDNHSNLGGFRHEANAFFQWLQDNRIKNVMTICGDRHWQYHSIHPSGVEEFACGALNDENARMGVPPGSRKGTDPEALIRQPYTSPKPSGGFLFVTAGEELVFDFRDDDGKSLYRITK